MLSPLVAGEPSIVDVLEQTTPRYTATLTDNTGAPIPAASLTALTLVLYVIKADGTTTFIRGVGVPQNILNANNVTVDATGTLAWSLLPSDTDIVDDTLLVERHIALFTWQTALQTGRHELHLIVKNLQEV